MVMPSKAPAVTFTAPADLVARLATADAAESVALDAACKHKAADNLRALATARRELADAYHEFASRFTPFFPVFHALREYESSLRMKAREDDRYAADLASRAGSGEPS